MTPPICAISIHAPARGATPSHNLTPAYRTDFNPRSREGSDEYIFTLMVQQVRFQSTLPRGERRMTVQIFQILAYFNPRSREGSDQNLRWKISAATEISIHAPARGATTANWGLSVTQKFQSTLPRGERLEAVRIAFRLPIISIHAPARGATFWWQQTS